MFQIQGPLILPDGIIANPPENPLKDKWDKLYPACSIGSDGWDYSCMFCGKCPLGDHWEVPDEDKSIWEQYIKDKKAYYDSHGGLLNGTFKVVEIDHL